MLLERDPYKLYPHDRLMGATVIRLIPSFVSPNAVTWFRFLATPFVIYLLYVGDYAAGVPFFIFIAFTDAVDGSLARLRRQITEWGMLYDPIADKLLIGSVVLLVVVRHMNPAFGLAIVGLEILLVIGGLRRRRRGLPVMANMVGKVKMFLQFLGVTFLLVALWSGVGLLIPFSVATLSAAIVVAILSLFTYGI